MGYKSVEWGWDQQSVKNLPDFILSLDSTSTSTFKKLNCKGVKVIEIKHPFNSRFRDLKVAKHLPFEWRVEIPEMKRNKRILVCLQWGYDGELKQYDGILSNGLYPNFFKNLIKNTLNDVEWCFRLHPVQLMNSAYKHHVKEIKMLSKLNQNVSWESWSWSPLPSLLPHVEAVVSMSSFASYDAAEFGRRSFVMCPTVQSGGVAEDWFEDLVEIGLLAKGSMCESDLEKWINSVEALDHIWLANDAEKNTDVTIQHLFNHRAA